MNTETTTRKPAGQAVIVTGMVAALIFVLSVGLYGFELNRVEVARQQLQAACEAAALAGAATLASSDETDPSTAQANAEATAMNQFQQNSVAGFSLGGALQAMDPNANPAPGKSYLYLEFQDPHNNYAAVPHGDPRGKIVHVVGTLGFQPAFGKFLGIGNVPLKGVADGGVPQLDLVLCFDVSASIDDQTNVTFVRRVWNSAQSKINYTIASTSGGAPTGALAEGTIYNCLGPPPTGSALDGLPPQTLQASNQSDHNYKLNFSEVSGRTGSQVGLRGSPEAGSPPGNISGGGTGNAQTYTDLVVNIDGNKHFNGYTSSGYLFPDLATLVEAARGNLENATVFNNSRANVSVPGTVRPRAGYQAEYRKCARENLHPLKDAQDACSVFLQIMNTNTDAHFSLVCFTSNAGNSATDAVSMANVDSSYGAGGTGNFPCQLISMDSAVNSTKYDECLASMSGTTAISGTNIGDAVDTAVTELRTHGRSGAKKAIVVFTDGQPTAGGPLNSDPWTNTRMAATNAKTRGYPIYTIGLAQVPAIIPGETAILNDTNNSPTSGGIAAIAGNGGKFWLVTSSSNLRATFENLARQLVQLVK